MKSQLILFYKKLLNIYYYNHNNDEEKSKKLAYVAIRNILGVVIIMSCLVFFVVISCVYNININLKENKVLIYFIFSIFIYLLIAKKFLKPIFDGIELKRERPPKDHFFLISVVLFGLFIGLMFVIARLLNFYLCK